MNDKLTTKSQEAIAAALQLATTAGNPHLEPTHLLAALLEQTDGIAVALLSGLGADVNALAQRARGALATLPSASAV